MASLLFSMISRDRMKEILENLYQFIAIPVHLIGNSEETLLSFGESPRFCTLLKKQLAVGNCFALNLREGHTAKELGEPYIFSCFSNLNHIACPIIHQKELLAFLVIGPFLMDTPDSTLITPLVEKHRLSPALSLELYDELSGIPILSPAKARQLSRLVGDLMQPLLPAEQALLKQAQEKLYQQSRIGEAIQMFKMQENDLSRDYFYEKENDLLSQVRTGNLQQSRALLNELIGYVLFSKGRSIEDLRNHAIELTTLLARVAIDGGASAQSVYRMKDQLIALITQEQNLENLCLVLQDVVESFISAAFYEKDHGNLRIRKALQYISTHYMHRLPLSDAAAEAGLSPNHFSALFSQVVGMHFRDYLCYVRVEESKRLLRSTEYSLAEISSAVGFPDQSYFSKAFKRVVGISPGRYRG